MATSKDIGVQIPADQDVDFAGYDPYIVAITANDRPDVTGSPSTAPGETTESRKVQLMAWLRQNGA
ncbi:MAG: hypothetical protein ABIX37_00295 [Gammaproteobacteria bacterium]